MILIKSMIIISLIMCMIVTLMTSISKKTMIDTQKMSPFECGFNPVSYPRLPFSIHFFSVAVIFLIFDVEIILIMPMIMTMKSSMLITWLMTSSVFTAILIIGLFHEWKNGMINWTE